MDSTLLLYAALDALGQRNVVVLRGISELVSEREKNSSNNILDELKITKDNRFDIELHPLIWSEFTANTPERCYFCKKRMYQGFQRILEKKDERPLMEGSNVDDLKSHRPGFRAIHELGIKTPLLDAGLNKEEIRALAFDFHLSNYNKPSNSCLATRLPEGFPIQKESLLQVERVENFLLSREFYGCRVRPEGRDIVLELTGDDAERLLKSPVRVEIIHFLQSEGFSRVLVDLKLRG